MKSWQFVVLLLYFSPCSPELHASCVKSTCRRVLVRSERDKRESE